MFALIMVTVLATREGEGGPALRSHFSIGDSDSQLMLLWIWGGPKTKTFNRLFFMQYCIKLCVYCQPANLGQGAQPCSTRLAS